VAKDRAERVWQAYLRFIATVGVSAATLRELEYSHKNGGSCWELSPAGGFEALAVASVLALPLSCNFRTFGCSADVLTPIEGPEECDGGPAMQQRVEMVRC
jgi:hypothetical protein